MASKGYHVYKVVTWKDITIFDKVSVERESDPVSLKHDRFSSSIRKLKVNGDVTPVFETVGHVPLEISKLCHYFLVHGGKIEGDVLDPKPRQSPILAGGQEVKLLLEFSGRADITDKIRQLLRQYYDSTVSSMGLKTLIWKRQRTKTVT